MAMERGKVITVERGGGRPSVGQGLLKSMAVVWDHWRSSFRKNQGFGDIRGTFTVQYPEERLTLPQTYRNMPILLFDDETGHELCTSCFQCQRICPPQVIHMTQAKDPATGKAVPAVTEFIVEYDACMSCGFCAEVCPFDAIKMDHEFELSTADHPSLTVRKDALNRPVSYYAGIAPDLWAEVRDGAMKKLQGNIKRRPDVIGMAPNLAEKIAARRRELAAAAPAPAPAAPAAPAEARALTAEEKAAKLAAIRAKNAGAPPPEAAPVAAAPEAPAASADEKAAKLAAIRAANAAKKAAEGGAVAPVAEMPAQQAAPVAEASAAPADEKAAKLAAIRAANAAKKAANSAPTTDPEGRPAPAPAAQAAAAAEAPEAAAASPEALVDPAREIAAPASREVVEAPPAAPMDEKAARLAAIRAANAAKKAAEQGGGSPGQGQEGGQ